MILGVTTTLNSYEEVELAKKLLNINQGFDGVKFARSGGEAMSVAIRLARAVKKIIKKLHLVDIMVGLIGI